MKQTIIIGKKKTELVVDVNPHRRASHTVSVYGAQPAGSELLPSEKASGGAAEYIVPPEFNRVYGVLTSIGKEQANEWVPDYIEVMIWPFEYATNEVSWPADWPGVSSPMTLKRGDSQYSIYMPGKMLPDLQAFLLHVPDASAILMDGRKWSLETRYVFPGESVWRRALQRTHMADVSDFRNPSYSPEAVRRLEEQREAEEAAQRREEDARRRDEERRARLMMEDTKALKAFDEQFTFDKLRCDGEAYELCFTGRVWRALAAPKTQLPIKCTADLTFPVASNETVVVGLTTEQVLGALEEICSTPFVQRIMRGKDGHVYLEASGDRLHERTDIVEEHRQMLERNGVSAPPAREWICFWMYLDSQPGNFVIISHPAKIDLFIVQVGAEHVEEWREACQRVEPDLIVWERDHWSFTASVQPVVDREGRLSVLKR
jgi:hypothetical protein